MNGEEEKRVAVVHVRLKDGVLDPQGLTIKNALENMGFKGIQQVRSGKVFEITFGPADARKPEELIDEICRKLLTNPVIENYKFEISK